MGIKEWMTKTELMHTWPDKGKGEEGNDQAADKAGVCFGKRQA